MNAQEVLIRAQVSGIVLSIENGQLRFRATAAPLDLELRTALVEHKAEIIATLSAEVRVDWCSAGAREICRRIVSIAASREVDEEGLVAWEEFSQRVDSAVERHDMAELERCLADFERWEAEDVARAAGKGGVK